MRSKWQNFKILQAINYAADRQEQSLEIRTSLSRGPLPSIKKDITLRIIISILFVIMTLKMFSQERQTENCFQTILDDDYFLAEMDKAEIKYCDSTLTLIKKHEKFLNPFYFRGTKLNTDYDSSKTCSYLSFIVVSKTRLKIMVKNPNPTIGKIATGEILLFDFKVKADDDGCKIKKENVEKRNYHARQL